MTIERPMLPPRADFAALKADLFLLRLSERSLDPRDVIAEILEEHLVMDPRAVADAIVEHLRDAGFQITPIYYPKRGG